MHPEYFKTRFLVENDVNTWPASFAIISAFATTGQQWTDSENDAADRRLENELRCAGVWHARITGFSLETGHAEPSWAVEVGFQEACDIGERHHQDAIYHVEGDALYVSYCNAHRALIPVDSFRSRIDKPDTNGTRTKDITREEGRLS